MQTIASDKLIVVVGLGATGLSCARFLANKGKRFVVMDSRQNPPGLEAFKAEFPSIACYCGGWNSEVLNAASEIILSPGVALATPEIVEAQQQGARVRGDIDLFSEQAKAPIVAITGSNGKSTVTTLVAEMAQQNGTRVAVGGNLGTPALDLLDDSVELYVLELSSFQLETTERLNAQVATLLNISEDHMDRYPDKLAYLRAKQRIFRGAKKVVVNDDHVLSTPLLSQDIEVLHFGLNGQDLNKFAIQANGESYALVRGFDVLVDAQDLLIKGMHNLSNALAALALGYAAGLRIDAMIKALKAFKGLAHRCQSVRDINGVSYIDDSKGTNTGATQVAIESIGKQLSGKVVLIAGGESKGADLSVLRAPVETHVKALVLIGRDAPLFEKSLHGTCEILRADSMADAVHKAAAKAEEGDAVLLSPACASFDMFKNYEQRGEAFVQEVLAL